MLSKTRTTIIAAVASVSFAGVAVIPTVAQAAKINEEDLKKDGYTCEKVTASFYICEKEGKKYYCTGDPKGKCELVPKRRPPVRSRVNPISCVLLASFVVWSAQRTAPGTIPTPKMKASCLIVRYRTNGENSIKSPQWIILTYRGC